MGFLTHLIWSFNKDLNLSRPGVHTTPPSWLGHRGWWERESERGGAVMFSPGSWRRWSTRCRCDLNIWGLCQSLYVEKRKNVDLIRWPETRGLFVVILELKPAATREQCLLLAPIKTSAPRNALVVAWLTEKRQCCSAGLNLSDVVLKLPLKDQQPEQPQPGCAVENDHLNRELPSVPHFG